MNRADYYLYDSVGGKYSFVRDAIEELTALREALIALASEPGQPHHAAETALKILNRES